MYFGQVVNWLDNRPNTVRRNPSFLPALRSASWETVRHPTNLLRAPFQSPTAATESYSASRKVVDFPWRGRVRRRCDGARGRLYRMGLLGDAGGGHSDGPWSPADRPAGFPGLRVCRP